MDSYRSMVEVLKQMKSVKIIKYLCHHEMEHKHHFSRCRHLSTAHCWTHHRCHPQHGYFRGHVTHEQLSALSNHPYNCWHNCFEKILGAVAELWNLTWGDVSTATLTKGRGPEKNRIFYGLLPNPPPRYGLFTDKKNYPYFFFRK